MADGEAPFFSVVIPTYRRPAMLQEAIASVLSQDWPDLELLVVDDDPDLSAGEAVARFADPRLHYLENDRARGGAGTRNAGIFRARGEWVAFLDDDDVWLPEKLARQRELIAGSDGELGMVYSGSAVFDFEKGQIVSRRRCSKEGWLARDLLVRNWLGGLFSVAIRKDLLLEVGGLDERFPALQDLDLFVRVARLGKVGFVDETLVLVRKDNSDRITRNARKKLTASRLFLEKYRDELKCEPLLMHRAAARVFTYAASAGNLGALVRSAPWMMAGLVLDPGNIREVLWRLLRQRHYDRSKHAEALANGGIDAGGHQ